jgi:glycosyltransferase involved in cell wall biosynthesis
VVYIHGHSSGGTNPSLVEAMHLELPIFAFDVNFNRYTTQNQAVYFTNSSELEEMVKHLDPKTLKNHAKKMKVIANDLYTWRRIVGEYEKLL